jgi:hypothetical protein
MNTNLKTASWLVALLLVTSAGCQKPLNYAKTFHIEPGDVQMFPIDAPRREQTIKVSASTSGVLVDVYVIADEDVGAAQQALQSLKKPAKVLGRSEMSSTKLDSKPAPTNVLETTIPAGTAFTVLITGAKKASEVTLEITSR